MRSRTTGLALGLALLGAACTAGDEAGAPASTEPAAPPPVTDAPRPAAFSLTGARVSAPDPGLSALPAEVAGAVQATLDRYLAMAVMGPLASGQPADDLAPLFTPNALARLDGLDRRALVDEGLPAATEVRVARAAAELSALAGPDGGVGVVLARIDLEVTSRIGPTPVTIHRHGEMTLVPAADGWRIDNYALTVSRNSPGPSTTLPPGTTGGGRP